MEEVVELPEMDLDRAQILLGTLRLHRDLAARAVQLDNTAGMGDLAVGALFFAHHPWLSLCQGSISMRVWVRAHVLGMEIAGSFMVAALFYASDAHSIDNVEGACPKPEGVGEMIGRSIVVAIMSMVLNTVPAMAVKRATLRGFVYRDTWDAPAVRSQQTRWQVMDVLSLSFGTVYIAFSIGFCAVFLANVAEIDAWRWTFS